MLYTLFCELYKHSNNKEACFRGDRSSCDQDFGFQDRVLLSIIQSWSKTPKKFSQKFGDALIELFHDIVIFNFKPL
jgi:hypothetical protein